MSIDNGSDFQVVDQLRGIALRTKARLTYFLAGVFMYDWDHRFEYQPPDRAAGSSSIGFQTPRAGLSVEATVAATVGSIRAAQTEDSELGSHFMGHFCGATGINTWTQSQWTAEIAQWNKATSQVDSIMGIDTGGGPVVRPVRGGRTPCLEGNPAAYLPAFAAAGYRYDASPVRSLTKWPTLQGGIWRFGIPSIPTLDGGDPILAIDYNFLVRYGDDGSQAREDMIYRALLSAFESQYSGNRAPFEFVAHTTVMMGGAYYRASERFLAQVCGRAEVRCGTYSEAVEWLDAHAAELPALQAGLFTGPIKPVPSGTTGAQAALVNIAMVDGVSAGYITADKCSRLTAGPQSFSNGNYPPGVAAVSNLSVVPVDGDGSFCVFTSSPVHLVVDVQGSFSPTGALSFAASLPARVLDSRLGSGRVAGGSIVRVPAGAVGSQAVLANVAMVDPLAAGYITADKCSRLVAGPQSFSNGNYRSGAGAASNLSVVPVDGDGSFCVFTSASVHLVVDVQGSFSSSAPLKFDSSAPTRVLDSRMGSGRVAGGSIVRVPAGAVGSQAVLANVAMVDPLAAGYITADKCSRLVAGPQSFSNGNYRSGAGAASNLSVVPVDGDGSFCVFTSASVHLVVDVQGSFSSSAPLKFDSSTPTRVYDSRP